MTPAILITADWIRDAVRQARGAARGGGRTALDALLQAAATDRDALVAALREHAGVDVLLDAQGWQPEFDRWDLRSAGAARALVLRDQAGRTILAAADPWDEATLQRVALRLGGMPGVAAIGQALLDRWLGGEPASPNGPPDAPRSDPARPQGRIVDFVDAAIRDAYLGGASDVHFECDRSGVTVKRRVDGVLAAGRRLDGVMPAEEVISRIKVLAQLDITERRLPQDGRFRHAIGERSLDLRVSIMPSVYGEDAVLRLLDRAQLRSGGDEVSLESLGFGAEEAARIRSLAAEPSGMLLVTGPTGSGKTTTVYAVLSEINQGLEKIITIEDPVEYELPGVLQIPVNERKGLTFARGLRSILRHDPDRILVGEIRDAETAEIAVQSALTGHLVFTTVHANGIADVMGRFRHFGLDMFGFTSSLNGVVVQRLLRRLCVCCRGDRPVSGDERAWLDAMGRPGSGRVPRAVGCGECRGSGYRGRFVLAEVHDVDDTLRDLVTEGAPVSAIRRHVAGRTGATLAQQAAGLVARAETTVEEVRRVVGWR